MQLAIVAAGYTPGEADQLRRSMAAWKRHGGLEHAPRTHARRHGRATATRREFAERIFEQIKGFGSYGFPESHAASFALIAYVSCWLKCHEPAAFACALLNSQPMGFYPPSQIVQDARRHGVDVRPVDVRYSDWDCTLEPIGATGTAAGACGWACALVDGLREDAAERIGVARAQRDRSPMSTDLCVRADARSARAQACSPMPARLRGLAGHRHRARWAVGGRGSSSCRCSTRPARRRKPRSHCRRRARSRTCAPTTRMHRPDAGPASAALLRRAAARAPLPALDGTGAAAARPQRRASPGW